MIQQMQVFGWRTLNSVLVDPDWAAVVFVRSGAGIVADSVPEKEYQECINKARAVVAALQEAEEAD